MNHPILPIPADEFLKDYWQQKPLLCPAAFRDFRSPFSAEELAGLALEEEVESRTVVRKGDAYLLNQGPFTETDFLQAPEHDWTLLVQGVDLWVPELVEVQKRFDFLPTWRMDDIMVSYANVGGGVGPHFDYYDVFLLQVEGHRRWQIGQVCDADELLRNDSELRILQNFEPAQEWVLAPGDMLYVPPCIAHWGVAESACMTYSVGFRAPTLTEMLDDLIIDRLANAPEVYFQDPPLTPEMASVEIDPAFVAQARKLLLDALDDEALLGAWFARYMTRPKYPALVDETDERRQALWQGQNFINGHTDD